MFGQQDRVLTGNRTLTGNNGQSELNPMSPEYRQAMAAGRIPQNNQQPNNGQQPLQGNTQFNNNSQMTQGAAMLNTLVRMQRQGTGSGGAVDMSNMYGFTNNPNGAIRPLVDLSDQDRMEQLRRHALEEASVTVALMIRSALERNQSNPFYKAIVEGFEVVRRLDPRNPSYVDPVSNEFCQMVNSNRALYEHILSQAGVMLIAMITECTVNGEDLRANQGKIFAMTTEATSYAIGYQCLDWLCAHPDSATKFHTASPFFREMMQGTERSYGKISARYNAVPGAQIPWGPDLYKNLTKRGQEFNHLLNHGYSSERTVANYEVQGLFPHHVNVNSFETTANPNNDPELALIWEDINRRNAEKVAEQRKQEIEDQLSGQVHYDYNQWGEAVPVEVPKVKLTSEQFSQEHRHHFDLTEFFKPIPRTDWSIGSMEDMKNIVPHFFNVEMNRQAWPMDCNVMNDQEVILVRFEQNNVFFKFVKVPTQRGHRDSMSFALTDPNAVLPFMWEEDGMVQSSYTPRSQTTEERCVEGAIDRIGQSRPLEEEPNILVGNRAIVIEEDSQVFAKLEATCALYDSAQKLDAMILPVKIANNFTDPEILNMSGVYSSMKMMVIGAPQPYANTMEMFQDIRGRCMQCPSESVAQFIRERLSSLVNRWLVEVRQYQPVRGEPGWLFVNDIFQDLEEFVAYLDEHDKPSLRAFMDLGNNTFIREGAQLFTPQKVVQERFTAKVDKDDVEALALAKVEADRSLVVEREAVVIKIRQEKGPRIVDPVKFVESRDPKLFAIIKEALERTRKHFTNTPIVLIEYEDPKGSYTRVATLSGFDPSVVTLTSLDGSHRLVTMTTVYTE